MYNKGWDSTTRYNFYQAGLRCAYSTADGGNLARAPEWKIRAVDSGNRPRMRACLAMFVNNKAYGFTMLNATTAAAAATEASGLRMKFEGCFGWGTQAQACYGAGKIWTTMRHGGFSGFVNKGQCGTVGSYTRCTAVP